MRRMTKQLFDRSKPHQDILAECTARLAETSVVRKDKVIDKLGYADVVDSINWDAIAERLKTGVVQASRAAAEAEAEAAGKPKPTVDLFPVAEAFFKADAQAKKAMLTGQRTPGRVDAKGNPYDDSFPGRYIAHGHGKKCVGYVIATYADGRFAAYVTELRRAQANGKLTKLKEMGERVTRRLVDEGKPGQVPTIAKHAGVTDLTAIPARKTGK